MDAPSGSVRRGSVPPGNMFYQMAVLKRNVLDLAVCSERSYCAADSRAVGISGLEAQVHPLNEHMEEDTICQGLTTQKKAARSSLTALSSGLPLVLLLQSTAGFISPSHLKY